MKQLLTLSAALALAFSTSAFAAAHKTAPEMAASAPMTKQQSKMGDCNKAAADKKGDERKTFMKTCLSAAGTTAAQVTAVVLNVTATGATGESFVAVWPAGAGWAGA